MLHCTVCGRLYLHERSLNRHTQSHHIQQLFTFGQCRKSFTRSVNLTKHHGSCTGHRVQHQQRPTTTITTTPPPTTTTPEFSLRQHRTTMGDAERYEIDMQETKHLDHISNAIHFLQPTMQKFQHKHQAYKFQIAITIVCHEAVDPSVVTKPPVALTSEMIAVYADAAPPLDNVIRQLLNFIEVFELNGWGWVFFHFESLQLTLWQLDPLRGSAYIPLSRWIQTKGAVVNVTGTGDDCFKWAVLVGMHAATSYGPVRWTHGKVRYFFFTFSRPSFFRWFFRIGKQHVYQRIWCWRRQRSNLSSPRFVHTCFR